MESLHAAHFDSFHVPNLHADFGANYFEAPFDQASAYDEPVLNGEWIDDIMDHWIDECRQQLDLEQEFDEILAKTQTESLPPDTTQTDDRSMFNDSYIIPQSEEVVPEEATQEPPETAESLEPRESESVIDQSDRLCRKRAIEIPSEPEPLINNATDPIESKQVIEHEPPSHKRVITEADAERMMMIKNEIPNPEPTPPNQSSQTTEPTAVTATLTGDTPKSELSQIPVVSGHNPAVKLTTSSSTIVATKTKRIQVEKITIDGIETTRTFMMVRDTLGRTKRIYLKAKQPKKPASESSTDYTEISDNPSTPPDSKPSSENINEHTNQSTSIKTETDDELKSNTSTSTDQVVKEGDLKQEEELNCTISDTNPVNVPTCHQSSSSSDSQDDDGESMPRTPEPMPTLFEEKQATDEDDCIRRFDHSSNAVTPNDSAQNFNDLCNSAIKHETDEADEHHTTPISTDVDLATGISTDLCQQGNSDRNDLVHPTTTNTANVTEVSDAEPSLTSPPMLCQDLESVSLRSIGPQHFERVEVDDGSHDESSTLTDSSSSTASSPGSPNDAGPKSVTDESCLDSDSCCFTISLPLESDEEQKVSQEDHGEVPAIPSTPQDENAFGNADDTSFSATATDFSVVDSLLDRGHGDVTVWFDDILGDCVGPYDRDIQNEMMNEQFRIEGLLVNLEDSPQLHGINEPTLDYQYDQNHGYNTFVPNAYLQPVSNYETTTPHTNYAAPVVSNDSMSAVSDAYSSGAKTKKSVATTIAQHDYSRCAPLPTTPSKAAPKKSNRKAAPKKPKKVSPKSSNTSCYRLTQNQTYPINDPAYQSEYLDHSPSQISVQAPTPYQTEEIESVYEAPQNVSTQSSHYGTSATQDAAKSCITSKILSSSHINHSKVIKDPSLLVPQEFMTLIQSPLDNLRALAARRTQT